MTASNTTKRSRLAINSVFMVVGIVSVSVLMLATDLVLIAGYDAVTHGRVTVALSIAILGAILCDVGLASKAGVKAIAALRQPGADTQQLGRTTTQLLLILTGIAGGGAFVLWIASPWLGRVLNLPPWAMQYAAFWLFAGAGVRATVMVFIGFEQMGQAMIITICAEAGRFVWACVCVRAGLEVETLYAGWAVTWLSSFGLGLLLAWRLMLRRRVPLNPLPARAADVTGTVWRGLPYLVPMLSAQALAPIAFAIAGVMLAQLPDGSEQISTLRICFSLALGIRILSQAVATSIFPIIARHTAEDGTLPSHLLETAVRAVRALCLAALGVYVVLLCLGPVGLGLIDQLHGLTRFYSDALPVLMVLTLAISADCYRVQIDQLLMGTGRIRVVTLGELIKLLLLVLGLPISILVWQGWPALAVAVTILIVLTLIASARSLNARRHFGPVGGGLAFRALLAMLALLPFAWLNSWWLVLPSACVAAVLLRLVSSSDIAEARKWFSKMARHRRDQQVRE